MKTVVDGSKVHSVKAVILEDRRIVLLHVIYKELHSRLTHAIEHPARISGRALLLIHNLFIQHSVNSI